MSLGGWRVGREMEAGPTQEEYLDSVEGSIRSLLRVCLGEVESQVVHWASRGPQGHAPRAVGTELQSGGNTAGTQPKLRAKPPPPRLYSCLIGLDLSK